MFPFLVVDILGYINNQEGCLRSIQRHRCPKAVVNLLKMLTVYPAWDYILFGFVLMIFEDLFSLF